jgi:signal transduction histidine kinase
MEGSPVRGQNRRNAWISGARDSHSLQSELVRSIGAELRNAEVVFGFVDTAAKSIALPAWMKAHLEHHPALYKKLEQGELVGISNSDKGQGLRPVNAAKSSVLLFPVISGGTLYGAIGLISPMDGPHLLQDELEMVRQIAQQAGPLIAHLNEIEQLRRENRDLKTLLEIRAHLQSNVAHELRTPLAAVRGYSRMILDGRAGQTNDTQKEYLRVVGDNTSRLIQLVSWMTRILEMSAQDFEMSVFDLRDVWAGCANRWKMAAAGKSLKLTEQIPDESFEVVGDRRKLARAFDHLLGGSMKFSTADSNILIQFSHGREREIAVKVADSGAIVPPQFLTRIFDRSFSSVPMPLAETPESTELGLSDVYDTIGIHGGRFFVNSKTGQGMTFLFTLPAIQYGGEEKPDHEQAVNSGR